MTTRQAPNGSRDHLTATRLASTRRPGPVRAPAFTRNWQAMSTACRARRGMLPPDPLTVRGRFGWIRSPRTCARPAGGLHLVTDYMALVGVQGSMEVTLFEIRSHEAPKLGRPGRPETVAAGAVNHL